MDFWNLISFLMKDWKIISILKMLEFLWNNLNLYYVLMLIIWILIKDGIHLFIKKILLIFLMLLNKNKMLIKLLKDLNLRIKNKLWLYIYIWNILVKNLFQWLIFKVQWNTLGLVVYLVSIWNYILKKLFNFSMMRFFHCHL